MPAEADQPRPEEACQYFSQGAVVGDIGVVYEEMSASGFELVATDLDRYATYVFRVNQFWSNAQGTRMGEVLAVVACVVDIKARRVLQITVGPQDGAPKQIVKSKTSGLLQIGAETREHNVGAQVHEGRY